jgi:hypothetical protein
MTTPYIVTEGSKADWLAFLKRAMVQFDLCANERTRLHHLMKYGPEPHYWNEFFFKAYHHHQQDLESNANCSLVRGECALSSQPPSS